MANKRKYIYGEQFAQQLPGSNQNFYFRTVTTYEVDNNGNPIEGTAGTNLYYAPKPAARTTDGKTWTAGTADSISTFNQGGWVVAGLTSDGGKTYIFERYTQEDANLGRIPSGKNVGDLVLGTTARQSLSTSGGRFYEAVQNNLINLAANTQPGLAQVVSAKQANAVQQQTSGTNVAPFSGDITDIEGVSDRSSYGPYRYPFTLDLTTQDVIKFTMIKPVATKFNTEFGAKTLSGKYNLDNNLGYVILPVQPSISDSNTVNWSGLNLNAFEAYGAGQAINLAKSSSITELFSKATGSIQDIAGKFLQSAELQQAAQIGLAQEAVGIQGLLSRATGAVINPNLELLFNGPELRTFAFTFRMSPRSKDDAYQVRSIIRFFKQGMSVKTTSSSIFLKSPHVFKIQYKTPGREDHPSINRIKICALVGCDVDYTPDGTYMTFNDEERKHPMTSYGMSLRFSEIEPVYDQDYKGFQEDEIGY